MAEGDTAYHSEVNEDFMDKEGVVSKVNRENRTSNLYPDILGNVNYYTHNRLTEYFLYIKSSF